MWNVKNIMGLPRLAQTVKSLPALQEIRVWSPGWEDPLEKEMATHSSILAWKISWTEEPGGLQSMGSQRVGHDWATNTHGPGDSRPSLPEHLCIHPLTWISKSFHRMANSPPLWPSSYHGARGSLVSLMAAAPTTSHPVLKAWEPFIHPEAHHQTALP